MMVKCINAYGTNNALQTGKVYRVEKMSQSSLYYKLEGVKKIFWGAYRFREIKFNQPTKETTSTI